MSTGISFEKRMIFLVVLLSDQMLSSVGEQIPLKDIPSGTGEPLKETENMLEDKMIKSYAQAQEVNLKRKHFFKDGKYKQIRMSTGEPLKNKEMFRDEKTKTGTYLR